MRAIESADGKRGRRGLKDRGEQSRDAAFAVGPCDVARWPSVGRQVREEETNAVQVQVNRHGGVTRARTRRVSGGGERAIVGIC